MKKYHYTTECTDNNMVIVRIYKKGSRKIQYKLCLEDYGDWNVIEDSIERFISNLS